MTRPDELSGVRDELARLQRRNELILTSAGEGIYGLDAEGKASFVNPAGARMLGWSIEELIGQPMHANHHHTRPDGRPYPRSECPIYAAFKDGRVHRVDCEVFWRKDGSSFCVEYTSTPILEKGKPVGAVVVFRDNTQRRQADEDLRRAMDEVAALKNQLQDQNHYLQEEISAEHNFHEIIGESLPMQAMRTAIETVAPSSANVLITGETGTGKELVARAIHASGPRRAQPLIKVNCASIPRELFESEFFGHVKGAFTGAIKDRAGRFQLANKGSLFLDEVGEIPLEMQSKLLRVLQEGEFERVGEEQTRRTDVRVIAATNRDLREDAGSGKFRQDLYYRLNVFPIEVAPLRQRGEDLKLLAQSFWQQAARDLKRLLPPIAPTEFRALQSYEWPGNVRELQNVIERAAITARGGRPRFDLPNALKRSRVAATRVSSSDAEVGILQDGEIRSLERDNIVAALDRSEWRIYGRGGAAELLGLKATTLASRVKKLGLSRPRAV